MPYIMSFYYEIRIVSVEGNKWFWFDFDLLEDGADGGGVDGPLRPVGLQQLQGVSVPQAGRVVLDKIEGNS